ncbi:YihY/virulence factor BrkB family protein [Gordonia asplenii]|uniref:YihY/virulence factor BrkB family protein n=1 Tax=Gordonia asplenii TaxID=2725283 RepID=UPI0028A75F4D|nr:YihY/virulence factor BrkB family protein [Gordonia asplenii]
MDARYITTRTRNPAPLPDDPQPGRRALGDALVPASDVGVATGDLDTAEVTDSTSTTPARREPIVRNLPKLVWRTAVGSFDHGIIGWAAQAAFWQALSLPPLLLGLLGSIGYVSGWFGPDTVAVIHERIIGFANRTFSENVVNDLIGPTVEDVLGRGRVGVVSIGFVLSLWAGSSAMSCFVSSIVHAHDQHDLRNPVWQRFFALFVYIGFLFASVFVLPLVAVGPTYLQKIVPSSWGTVVANLIDIGYFPLVAAVLVAMLTTLYHLALPNPLPWHRLIAGAILAAVFFWIASYILRIYLTEVTRSGYTYGALATPIAFLLFCFFLGFAIVVGAELNAAIQSIWPAKPAAAGQVKEWVQTTTAEITGGIRHLPHWSTGPIKTQTPDDDESR